MINSNDILNMLPGSNNEILEDKPIIKDKPIYNPIKQKEIQEQKSILMFKDYQHNILLSADLRTKINKGVQENQDIYILLIDAIKCISLMTDDKLFYKNNVEKLNEDYQVII